MIFLDWLAFKLANIIIPLGSSVSNLSSVLEVSVGVGLTYLALDRFRYNRQVEQLLEDFIKNRLVSSTSKETKEELRTLIRDIKKDVITKRYGHRWYRTYFVNSFRLGRDRCIVSLFVLFNILFLYLTAAFAETYCGNYSFFLLTACSAIIGFLLPTNYIWKGYGCIKEVDKELGELSRRLNLDLAAAVVTQQTSYQKEIDRDISMAEKWPYE